MKSRNRSGFTAIEILVILAIIACLLVILIPAVQSAKESAQKQNAENLAKENTEAEVLEIISDSNPRKIKVRFQNKYESIGYFEIRDDAEEIKLHDRITLEPPNLKYNVKVLQRLSPQN